MSATYMVDRGISSPSYATWLYTDTIESAIVQGTRYETYALGEKKYLLWYSDDTTNSQCGPNKRTSVVRLLLPDLSLEPLALGLPETHESEGLVV